MSLPHEVLMAVSHLHGGLMQISTSLSGTSSLEFSVSVFAEAGITDFGFADVHSHFTLHFNTGSS